MALAEATFVAAGPLSEQTPSSLRIQNAMLEAVQKAQSEGVTDSVEVRALILAARDAAAAAG
jgi:hypothetical protein